MLEEWEVFLPRSNTLSAAWGDLESQKQWGVKCLKAVEEGAKYLEDNKTKFSDQDFAMDFLKFFGKKRKEIAEQMGKGDEPKLGELRLSNSINLPMTPIEQKISDRYRDQFPEMLKIIQAQEPQDNTQLKVVDNPSRKVIYFKETGTMITFQKPASITIAHPADQKVRSFVHQSWRAFLNGVFLSFDPVQDEAGFYKKLGELSWHFYQVMPFERGSAAIGDMLTRAIMKYNYPNKLLQPYNTQLNIDLVAICTPKDEFSNNYHTYFATPEALVQTANSEELQQASDHTRILSLLDATPATHLERDKGKDEEIESKQAAIEQIKGAAKLDVDEHKTDTEKSEQNQNKKTDDEEQSSPDHKRSRLSLDGST